MMRAKHLVLAGIIAVMLAGLIAASCDPPVPAGPRRHGARAGTAAPVGLPASLAQYYPPKAAKPVWLMAMFGMSMPLEGMMVDMQQGDKPGIMSNWKAFKAAYIKVRTMVPEWTDRFPTAPLAAVEAAMKTGDPKQVMPAFMKLAANCKSCHLENMVPVQALYHWPSFAALKVTDPVTKQELPWKRFKMGLSMSMAGIGNDLKQGQRDRALKHLANFKARFAALKVACKKCHDSPRAYYVDVRVDAIIAKLETAVKATPPNPKEIMGAMMALGQQSCAKCHHVHVPAAMMQAKLAGKTGH